MKIPLFNLLKSAVLHLPLLAIAALTLLSQPSFADQDASAWIKTEQTSVRLIAARSSIGDTRDIKLGLQFKIKKGWKIYWRSPGDAGFPPKLEWQKSENLVKTKFSWPLPTRFSVLNLQTLGYKGEVVFPITATVKDPSQALKLRADLNYLVCDDICIPYSTSLSLDVPTGTSVERLSENYHLISQYTAKVPGDGTAHNLSIESVETTGGFTEAAKDVRKGFIRIKAKSGIPFAKPDVFIEGPDLTFYGKPIVSLNRDRSIATIKVPVTEEEDAKLVTASLRLTLKDGARSAERTLTVTPGQSAPPGTESTTSSLPVSLPVILVFALMGGLILNLMPCVLPVISLKILSVVSHGGAEDKTVRTSFIASSLGIIFSFLAISGGLIGLKIAGATIGWGIQFQHPWFIVALSIIVTLFAYNLWGLFELRLPAWLSERASRSTGQTEDHQSFSGNFATGAFATLLATPCSAPFLGTAIGFALAGSVTDILAVFLALGVGMSLPFLTIATFPRLASRMPKPGNWMLWVKKVLGGALALTAIWLLSVLATQLSLNAALIVSALLIFMGLILRVRDHLPEMPKKLASLAIIVIILGAFWTPYSYPSPTGQINPAKEAYWRPLDPDAIPQLVAEGKTVFVDVTADWCITCLVNKATVLNRGEIHELLTSGKLIAMQGDWTRPDPKIAAYLKSFGRFGIPFNAIYGPGTPLGKVLPELLTTGAVLSGIAQASNGTLIVGK